MLPFKYMLGEKGSVTITGGSAGGNTDSTVGGNESGKVETHGIDCLSLPEQSE